MVTPRFQTSIGLLLGSMIWLLIGPVPAVAQPAALSLLDVTSASPALQPATAASPAPTRTRPRISLETPTTPPPSPAPAAPPVAKPTWRDRLKNLVASLVQWWPEMLADFRKWTGRMFGA